MSVTTFAQASGPQLRSKMEGMILDNRFKLPELERVRVDAAEGELLPLKENFLIGTRLGLKM